MEDIINKMYYPYDKELEFLYAILSLKELVTVDNLSDKTGHNQNWSWDKILRSCFIKTGRCPKAYTF